MIAPGVLVTLHDVSIVLHSDWNWQQEDSATHHIGAMTPGQVALCVAVVTGGYPRRQSQQVCVLTKEGRLGWQSKEYFREAW